MYNNFKFAVIYIVEFQKCGLPHAHILLFLDKKKDKYPTCSDIDRIISAKIPDEQINPYYYNYNAIKDYMIHGP